MSAAPESLKFLESHEWIDAGPELATVGITDHAQSEMSDIVYVELPETGRQVAAREAVAVVESVKAASDIYAPVSGEIVEVNEALGDNPGLVNSDAFGAGWLFRIRPGAPEELDRLLDHDAYLKSIG